MAPSRSETDDTDLVRVVRRLSHKANIPMPKVYIIDSPVPNAFATGRNPRHGGGGRDIGDSRHAKTNTSWKVCSGMNFPM